MQLVAYGAQDIYLTGNPQITFFKVVYRRHTNFAMESVEQTINGTVAAGSTVSSTISRNGDLVNRMYLQISSDDGTTPTLADNHGTAIVNYIECEIGGQRIDKHYGHWMEVWYELTEENPYGFNALAGNLDVQEDSNQNLDTGAALSGDKTNTKFQRMAAAGGVISGQGVDTDVFYVPLTFWFCRNPGLALPLIALQYHEVKIKVAFSSATQTDTSVSLWADYIYLDTDERRRFAQVSHEYLIEQVQSQSFASGTTHTLTFNHPVKELVFVGTSGATWKGQNFDPLTGTFQLKLNGHDRFKERDASYFTRTQVWQHHTGYGGVSCKDSIGVYSFALKPEEHQPSGTCNFSRIDNAQLVCGDPQDLEVYAVNYNVLRIMSGMGGLAYSN